MKEMFFDKYQYINEEFKKTNVQREEFGRYNHTTFKEKRKGNMKERIFDKDQYINEELKKVNVRREDFDRWVNILKEEYERENGK